MVKIKKQNSIQKRNTIAKMLNSALGLHKNGSLNDALLIYQDVLKIDPNNLDALNLSGVIYNHNNQAENAIQLFNRAISINSNIASVYSNRGLALQALGRNNDAALDFSSAIRINPIYAEAFYNLANVQMVIGDIQGALASYDKALDINQNYAAAHNNKGALLTYISRYTEAFNELHQALSLAPYYVDALVNMGNLLLLLKQPADALIAFKKALSIQPKHPFLRGIKLNTQLKICDWEGLATEIQELEHGVLNGEKVTVPFVTLGLTDNPHVHLNAAKIYVENIYPPRQIDYSFKKTRKDKIRIGYYSADFRNHPGAYLMAGLFEQHDRTKFEVYGFSFGPDTQDAMRKRISRAFDKFIDIREMSDKDVIDLSRNLEIDIAIDRKGHTEGARPGIFAGRVAPIQVAYLAYPGPMGASYIDYVIADQVVLPEASQEHYSEKIIRLPQCYMVQDSKRGLPNDIFTKSDLNLPEESFVFCCFNNSYKILPDTFQDWMRILKATDGSVLWLLENNKIAAKNLQLSAFEHGVDPKRLIFAPAMSQEQHLSRHLQADLFLDTFPYNAHTTASDALWCGVPVLTRPGKSFASRVAASLLAELDLPELITNSRDEYIERAIFFNKNQARLNEFTNRLKVNRHSSHLFDTKGFTRQFELACEVMIDEEFY